MLGVLQQDLDGGKGGQKQEILKLKAGRAYAKAE